MGGCFRLCPAVTLQVLMGGLVQNVSKWYSGGSSQSATVLG